MAAGATVWHRMARRARQGEKDVIETLYNDIEKDRRHHLVTVLVREDASDRMFSDWGMGFQKVDADRREWAGAFRLSRETLAEKLPENIGAPAKTLIGSFMEVNAGSGS
jgi:hypothetical protein